MKKLHFIRNMSCDDILKAGKNTTNIKLFTGYLEFFSSLYVKVA